jgi:hypothetical protein
VLQQIPGESRVQPSGQLYSHIDVTPASALAIAIAIALLENPPTDDDVPAAESDRNDAPPGPQPEHGETSPWLWQHFPEAAVIGPSG